jgi:hypothetical protein
VIFRAASTSIIFRRKGNELRRSPVFLISKENSITCLITHDKDDVLAFEYTIIMH